MTIAGEIAMVIVILQLDIRNSTVICNNHIFSLHHYIPEKVQACRLIGGGVWEKQVQE